ncbi:MAG: FtsX-like permease family protein [Rhodoferax sp.]
MLVARLKNAPLWGLLRTFSWQELRQHPWRHAAAGVAVMLGVALAFSVHLINASALDEFAQASRALDGQSDLSLQADAGFLADAHYPALAQLPGVAQAAPLLDIQTVAVQAGQRRGLRVIGIDALTLPAVLPELLPRPAVSGGAGADATQRGALFDPQAIYLNAAAQRMLNHPTEVTVQSGLQLHTLRVAGAVAAPGVALAVMDIAAAQDLFDKVGLLSRIELRLYAGENAHERLQSWRQRADWPAGTRAQEPGAAPSQADQVSRAYRVNLTVLALIALFTGAFLVFSVLSLSVAKRAQQLALIGVLGLAPGQRQALVAVESLLLGLVGSVAGIALGTALASLALSQLGGDLGGGFFAGVAPRLQWSAAAALVFAGLGVAASLAGGWWPARAAAQLPLAATLKGLGVLDAQRPRAGRALAMMATGGLLTMAPPVAGMALAAYVAIALMLLGGIALLPALIAAGLRALAPWVRHRPVALLALERARRGSHSASAAVSGVVAALSLAVALTVMVASFRDSVTRWLDQMLPADLYVRSGSQLAAADTVFFSPEFVAQAQALQGVLRLQAQRQLPLSLRADTPPVALLARELDDPQRQLPLNQPPLPVPPGAVSLYVSEAVVDLFGLQPGRTSPDFYKAFMHLAHTGIAQGTSFFIAGVWRDYARQSGAVVMRRADFVRLTGDARSNDLAFWLAPGTPVLPLQNQLQALAAGLDAPRVAAAAQADPQTLPQLLEFGTATQIRAISLKVFDRSFAVTVWLQAVAIGIGLFGVAASFSAQVLARRKEFGLLSHLGLTRAQILRLVALEGLLWSTLGTAVGLALGCVVAVVLVHVVNPQSFHWRMDLSLPGARLGALCAAVVLAGTLTAWLAGRCAASPDAVAAVKEDW